VIGIQRARSDSIWALAFGGVLVAWLLSSAVPRALAGGLPGSLHVTLTGNGTVSVVGGTDNVIECQRSGGTTFGTCDWSYYIDAVPTVSLKATTPIGSAFCDTNGCYAEGATTTIELASTGNIEWMGFVGLDNRFITVGKLGTGTGSVTSTDGRISCPVSCQGTGRIGYTFGDHVTLHAAAASGSTLVGWNGLCGGQIAPTCDFVLNTPEIDSVTAPMFKANAATPAPTKTAIAGHSTGPSPSTAVGHTQPVSTSPPAPTDGAPEHSSSQSTTPSGESAVPTLGPGVSAGPVETPSAAPVGEIPASTPASLDTGWIAFLLLLVLVIGVSVGGAIAFVAMRRRAPPPAK
jgi:hypothetical protein